MQLLVAFDSNGFRNDKPRRFVKNIVCKHVLSLKYRQKTIFRDDYQKFKGTFLLMI